MLPLMLTFMKMCCTASNLYRCTFHCITFPKSSWKMRRARKYVYAYAYLAIPPVGPRSKKKGQKGRGHFDLKKDATRTLLLKDADARRFETP